VCIGLIRTVNLELLDRPVSILMHVFYAYQYYTNFLEKKSERQRIRDSNTTYSGTLIDMVLSLYRECIISCCFSLLREVFML
jgi:hypothetical protein